MTRPHAICAVLPLLLATAMLGGCPCEDCTGTARPGITQYSIGGVVSGLEGATLVLHESITWNSLAVAQNGAFRFPATTDAGSGYFVSVQKQPAGQHCLVGTGSGAANANVNDVLVSCSNEPFTVGGMVSGVGAPIVLQLNLGNNMQVAGDGVFTFPAGLSVGATYTVSVAPEANAAHRCTVVNASGTIVSSVSNVAINCTLLPVDVAIGGIVQGLGGQPLTLHLNAGSVSSALSTSTNGAFQFADTLPVGMAYFVTVASQPSGQHCVVTNASGFSTPASDAAIGVQCNDGADPQSHSVSGSVAGLTGALRLRLDKNNDLLTVNSAGGPAPFSFINPIPVGTPFRILVDAQPPGQTCIVLNGGATMGGANITDISVVCEVNVTDPLSGTFMLTGAYMKRERDMVLTFYPDGVYVAASVRKVTGCFTSQGNGVEAGAYRYNAAAGTLILISNVVDTNGADCGVWRTSNIGSGIVNGTVSKTGTGQDLVLVTAGATQYPLVMIPVSSEAAQPIGSFTTGTPSFLMFMPDGRYLHASANHNPAGGEPAGVEYGCYTRTGTASGTIAIANTGCTGTVDTNGTAGLSALAGASLPYQTLDPYRVDFGSGLTGFRILPGN